MEEDIHDGTHDTPFLKDHALKRLREAVEIAGERISYEAAHNEDLLRALDIVKAFLKRTGRVCYGGTAMNMILPPEKRFYNPELDLPDYDFFTPNIDEDVKGLVADFKKAGFKDVYHRVGVHAGTQKILVNFVPVADVSSLDPDLYRVFHRRAIRKEGVRYTDPDVLRMMMYLELSRPRGQVDRWEKVYERLDLINTEFPPKGSNRCVSASATRRSRSSREHLSKELRSKIIGFIIENQRILCSGPLETLYRRGISHADVVVEARPGGPILFSSPEPKADALALKPLLGDNVKLYIHKEKGEIVPERIEIQRGGRVLCVIVKESACHSYHHVPYEDGRILFIASLEFLITLYTSLALFTKHSAPFIEGHGSLMCRVKEFVQLAEKNLAAKKSQFPAFPITCRGYQKGYATLLREKVERIFKEKAEAGVPGSYRRSATRKQSRSKKEKRRST
jgi:hypothetical protein